MYIIASHLYCKSFDYVLSRPNYIIILNERIHFSVLKLARQNYLLGDSEYFEIVLSIDIDIEIYGSNQFKGNSV